jgi:predicted DNA-binding transcriptional regulator AlpA
MNANVLDDFLTEEQCAKVLGRSVRTLRTYRRKGDGPAFTRIGAQVRYRVEAIRDWLVSNEIKPRTKRR